MVTGAALTGFPNFRPLGGQRTASGAAVHRGLVFRSEALLAPGGEDAAALTAAGIELVCDLRSDAERRRAPNRWWATRDVERLDLDLLGALAAANRPWPILRRDPSPAGAAAAMRAVYAGLPSAAAAPLALLFRRIAAGGVPVLIHCTAGKDRTGFVSAVLLAALGVPRDAIVADYLGSRVSHSAEAIAATRALAVAHTGTELSADALAVMMGVEPAYLDEGFAVIERDHGGVPAYLAAAGLTAAEIAALRDRLLARDDQPIT